MKQDPLNLNNTVISSTDQAASILQNNDQPIFFISRSATNLLGINHWVKNFFFVTLVDSWETPNSFSFTPSQKPHSAIRGNITIANWLLKNKDVQRFISSKTPAGIRPKIILAMFDKESERLCSRLGFELLMPTVETRHNLDSKIVTTEIGNKAGVASAPNVIATFSTYQELQELAESNDLGQKLVLQLPYGDTGRTTFFVSTQADFDTISSQVRDVPVKIMKNISHIPYATEAVILDKGVVLGPIVRELTGHKELTDYPGGWCGSEQYPGILDTDTRKKFNSLVLKFSNELASTGYRGILGIDVLRDLDNGELYLGELNPRITGSSSQTNLTHDTSMLPLFAFHLLEFMGFNVNLDFYKLNQQREEKLSGTTRSTMIVPIPGKSEVKLKKVPETGVYTYDSQGNLTHYMYAEDWHELSGKQSLFFFRGVDEGATLSARTDLGMVMTTARVQEETHSLTPTAKGIISAFESQVEIRKIPVFVVFFRSVIRKIIATILGIK
jgi:hypothetical protein